MKGIRGFTLIELLVVVAIIAVLTSIAIPIFANVTARSRIAKAQADVRSLASSVSAYAAHMGVLPAALSDLTLPAVNPAGHTAGQFLPVIPQPPGTNWSSYGYSTNVVGLFTVSASGDNVTVSGP